MNYKDYYKVLGVKPSASNEEIRKVYKKLAVKYHPDSNPGNQAAEDRFKEISEAKEILLDTENRQKYDQLRRQYTQFQQGGGGVRGGATEEPEFNNIFSTFFDEVFGRRKNAPRRGKNFEAHIKVSLEEAYNGLQDVLSFEGRRLRVKIKPGIENGQTLRIKGQGGPGKLGGSNGDLYLSIKIKPHERFERQGNDLSMQLDVSLYTAVLGGKAEIKTLKGPVKISIPAGTQPGERLKLRGMGMPHYTAPDRFGDLYVQVQVPIPKRLNARQKELFEELASLSS